MFSMRKETLREYRKGLGITIEKAASVSRVPYRTFVRYESDESYGNELKRECIFARLEDEFAITENKGILQISDIRKAVGEVISEKRFGEVEFCYLFGSYAKGTAKGDSDIDLLVATSLSGLSFVSLIEELNKALHKRIDLIRLSDITSNGELLSEIMRYGIKIYG